MGHEDKKMKKSMISFLILIGLSVFAIKTMASEVWKEYLNKAGEVAQKEYIYKAIPWLDMAMENSAKNIQPFQTAANYEQLFVLSEGKFIPDMLGFCNILKRANKIGGFSSPAQLGGKSSTDLEKIICVFPNELSGDKIFSWGLSVMDRTGADMSGMARALPYFLLAEKKGLSNKDLNQKLYQAKGLIYYAQGSYEKAKTDLLKFIKFKEKIFTEDDAFTLMLLAQTQFITDNSELGFNQGLSNLRKSASLGNERAREIIQKVEEIHIRANNKGLKRASWADSQIDNGMKLYGFTCNGEFMSVSKDEWYLASWGLAGPNCTGSSTTNKDSVQSLAKSACDCFLTK